MKFDWEYVTRDRAKVNIALAASAVIRKLAEERKTGEIVGACMLMNALMDSMGDGDE